MNKRSKVPREARRPRRELDSGPGMTVLGLFENAARAFPDVPAVLFGNQSLTYRELAGRADRLARHLRGVGVTRDVLAGIAAERSLELAVGVLAIAKAGGACLPFDAAYPRERLRLVIEETQAPALLTQRNLAGRLPESASRIVFLEDAESLPLAQEAEPAMDPSAPESLAYVLYTSGSTGKPKGVAMPHRPLRNLVEWQMRHTPMSPGARTLQFASLGFDVAFQEIFSTWCAGGTLVLVPESLRRDPRGLLRLIGESEVKRAFLPYVALAQLAEVVDAGAAPPRSLSYIITAGEPLRVTPAIVRLFEKLPACALENQYGPTETHVVTAYTLEGPPRGWPALPPIGRPIPNCEIRLLDAEGRPVLPGEAGELCVGGVPLARGYLGRAALTAERFVPDPNGHEGASRLYRTGDLARLLPDGTLAFLGRSDQQLKVRGFRVEPAEVEAALGGHPEVADCAVVPRTERAGETGLTAWVVPRAGMSLNAAALRAFLRETLPEQMVPSRFLSLDSLPRTPNGKLDRIALRDRPEGRLLEAPPSASESSLLPAARIEEAVAGIWREVLGLEKAGLDDNFFDLGGHSLHLARIQTKLGSLLGREIPILDLFDHPTISSLSRHLARGGTSEAKSAPLAPSRSVVGEPSSEGIAIIGMAGRFPGARNAAEFWENLKKGVETISRFTDEELSASGIEDPALISRADYVRARAVLEGVDLFDAEFFGVTPREAELMDPQHRIFLECSWEALEDAGCDPQRFAGKIGVFAGLSLNTYLLANLCADRPFIEELVGSYQVGAYQTMMGNDKDYLPTRVSYKLGLRGPSLAVATACSTSLVAVAIACQNLQTRQCDVALAGGVSISFPQKRGYLYQEGGMVSPDGRCRPFDAKGEGTVFGAGAGIVVLKRLSEALRDGDAIAAVIRGAAVNNDGSGKVGYTAPSLDGQAEVITAAQTMAGFSPETISYVEAHGTATPLGDPIEVAGLTRAFRRGTERKGFCAIGSVKSNVGHLEAASGIAGLIKTALCLKHRTLVPTLHYERPNPQIAFAESPFFVNTALTQWKGAETPRRAGVSSFGVGGTNAHVVLEEAPEAVPSGPSRSAQLLLVSAKSGEALEKATANLAEHLRGHPAADLADVAYTLQTGRRRFAHRRMLVCGGASDAIRLLSAGDPKGVLTRAEEGPAPSIAFLFPGQGAQLVNMARGLYEAEPAFRERMDEGARLLSRDFEMDLLAAVYPAQGEEDRAARELSKTALTQPALFLLEYALAGLWQEWGIRAEAMLGHSVGEYVAACLAGVFSFEDALSLVAERGRLIQALPAGAMLAVRLSEKDLVPLLTDKLSLAAVNGSSSCVVSGPESAVSAFEERLGKEGTAARRLQTSHAFHSAMMEPVLERFARRVEKARPAAPRSPYISNLTGTWIRAEEATDPAYWAEHLRRTVRFRDGLEELFSRPERALLEVGPGDTLARLGLQEPARKRDQLVVPSLPAAADPSLDVSSMLDALGKLWLAGAAVDWNGFSARERRRRIALPTYPFERKRFWVEPPRPQKRPEKIEAAPRAERPEPGEVSVSASAGAAPSAAFPSRREEILVTSRGVLSDLSGLDLSGTGDSVSFLEMGFDSLFLTQASQGLSAKFGVKITFRQLQDELSTLSSLADHIEKALPPARPRPAAAPAPAANALERVLDQQLELTGKLLEMIRGASPETAARLLERMPEAGATVSRTEFPLHREESGRHGPYRPIEKTSPAALTEHQRKSLDALIARTTRRTPESKRRTQDSRARLADPRAVAGFRPAWKEMVYPIVAARSSGSKIWDVDGNEYVDVTMGFGVNLFGHSPPFVTEAVRKQLELGVEIGPQSPLVGEVADLICEFTGMDRVTFCNTGSEAVMAALRIARTVTGRDRIALFSGAYHGTFDEVLVRAGQTGGRSVPVAPGIPAQAVQNVLVLDYGTPESLEILRREAANLAAVLVEPVQSRHPDLQPEDFLRELRRLTEEAGTALIFDEVITGFRTHPGGAQARFGVRADIATYGKVIGGGMPIGVVAGGATYMDAFDGGLWSYGDDSSPPSGVTFFAGTFVRHPLALAAARAVLWRLKEAGPALQNELNERTRRFTERLNRLLTETGAPLRVTHFGSIFYFDFATEWKFASLLFYFLRVKGVHIWEGRPCFLSTAHTDEDIERLVSAFEESVAEMREGGFLPEAAPLTEEGPSRESSVPLTEAQKEMWLAAQMGDESSCAHNESCTLTLQGELDFAALREAIQDSIARHEALRTTFDPKGETQRIGRELRIEIPFEDLSGESEPERRVRVDRVLSNEDRQAFDLVSGPLIRARVLRLEERLHLLVLTVHHIVCDGWSYDVLLHDLAQLYSARKRGVLPTLSPPARFSDYVRWEEEEPQKSERGVNEVYWKERFQEPPPALELPLDAARPLLKTYSGAREAVPLPAAWYAEIKRGSAKEGSTHFTILLAGFLLLLRKLTGQDDHAVGVPAAGQVLFGEKRLVGHCVNFLPLRSHEAGDPSFSDFLRAVKRILLDAYDHQNYTFGSLLQKLSLPRDPGRLPLISAIFNIDPALTALEFAGLSVAVAKNPRNFVNADLVFNLVETEGDPVLECEYNTDLFTAETVRRWMDYYRTLLDAAVGEPQKRLSRLPMLRSAESRRLIFDWNETTAEFPREKTLHRIFEEKAMEVPGAFAVDLDGRRHTYTELNAEANRLARRLRALGVGPETAVGVCMEPSPEMVVGLLAILKAGGAYVPLDPSHPKERLSFLLDDSRASLVLTERRLLEALPLERSPILCLDAEAKALSRESAENLPNAARSGNLAYVIYTSGSSGRPKGVAVTHKNVVASTAARMSYYAGPPPGFLLLSPFSFDSSVAGIFSTLFSGGVLHFPPPRERQDPAEIVRQVTRHKITRLLCVPSLWAYVLEEGRRAGGTALAGLREVIVAGEACPAGLVRAHRALLPGVSLYNEYGPTEATVWSTVYRVVQAAGSWVPIGRPIANTRVYVLDGEGEPVPVGVSGEISIGGEGVARGYHNCPELTAEKFLPDPFNLVPGARLYRTGDRARLLPDGNLVFAGRGDRQVKVRGHRVEIGEIEAALCEHPGLVEAAVVPREGPQGETKLVAFVAPRGATGPTSGELRSFLAAKLPEFLLPASFVTRDALPRTTHGKLDRRALGLDALDRAETPARGVFASPRTPVEKLLCDIWAEVLGLLRVGIDEDFFELGGHSLLAMRVISRMRDAFSPDLPLRMLFEAPTVASLAVSVAQFQARGEAPEEMVRLLAELEEEPSEEGAFRTDGAPPHS